MSHLDRLIEQQIAEAAERGEMDTPNLRGKPIPDLGQQRRPGWWAEQFAQRERARAEAQDAEAETPAEIWRREAAERRRRAGW